MLNGESPTINNMHRGQNSTLYTARALSYNHKGINTHTHPTIPTSITYDVRAVTPANGSRGSDSTLMYTAIFISVGFS